MTTPDASGRNAALDAARGLLMMLGVFLHASNIYGVDDAWLVRDTERSIAFDVIGDAIHVFRMPAFFCISGFFAAFTFVRDGPVGLLRKRLFRIGLPLFTSWATLNLATEIFVARQRGQDPATVWLDGVPIYHLWFLVDLAIFILLAALVLPRVGPLRRPCAFLERVPVVVLVAGLSLATLAVGLAVRATGVGYRDLLGLTSLYRLATYAPYFAAGILLYSCVRVRESLLRVPIAALVPAVALAIVAERYTKGHPVLVNESAQFVKVLMTWIAVFAILRLFHVLFPRDTRATRLMSEVAYTVFLFHHLFVVILGTALLGVAWGPWPKFLAVSLASLFLALLVHLALFPRSAALRMLFNGK